MKVLQRRKILSLASNKKGNAISDSIIIIVALFAFAYITLQGNLLINEFDDEIQNDTSMSEFSQNISSDLRGRYATTMDDNFMTAFFLLWVFGMVASYLVDTRPIFLALMILAIIAEFVALVMIANIYDELTTEDSDIAAITTGYPFMTYVMNHYYPIMVFVTFTILIPLFMKMKNG